MMPFALSLITPRYVKCSQQIGQAAISMTLPVVCTTTGCSFDVGIFAWYLALNKGRRRAQHILELSRRNEQQSPALVFARKLYDNIQVSNGKSNLLFQGFWTQP